MTPSKQKEDAALMDILARVGKATRATKAAEGCYQAGDKQIKEAQTEIAEVQKLIVQFRDRKNVKDKDE